MSISIDGREYTSLHFIGILGSGMSAAAQFLRWMGCDVSGSDRLGDSPEVARTRKCLEALGCPLSAQDGSGLTRRTQAVVLSTAIEESNPDVDVARARGLPVFHRSEILAAIVAAHRTIAVAGTSGKSTVTAMIFEFLRRCGKDPSMVGGAALLSLTDEGLIGNAWRGSSNLLVIEADESDGTLVRYHPWLTVVLNVSKDHKPVDETLGLFGQLASNSQLAIRNADDAGLSAVPAQRTFALEAASDCRFDALELRPEKIRAVWQGRQVELPIPGRHNAANLLAAFAACACADCDPDQLAAAPAGYRGIARRFAVTRTGSGVIVVDDFAHNPEKVRAAIAAARGLAPRIVAVFQPHGFGPTRFLKDDFIAAFGESLTHEDALVLRPIYYAGGTAAQDISSGDLAGEIAKSGVPVFTPNDRGAAIEIVRREVRPGDCVLTMGARDPGLEMFAREIVAAVS